MVIKKNNEQIVTDYYEKWEENKRVLRDQAHMTEFYITMHYIEQYLSDECKVLEVGSGTGIYSLELARRGYDVTAVDISSNNLDKLRNKATDSMKLKIFQRNATELYDIADDTYDVSLCLGPLYHLFDKEDIDKAVFEVKRVTKKKGCIFITFLSQDYILMRVPQKIFLNPQRYLTEKYEYISNMDEAFYYFKISDFRMLMDMHQLRKKHLFTMDGITSFIRDDINELSEEAYEIYLRYLIQNCEREELLGFSPHLCYVSENV